MSDCCSQFGADGDNSRKCEAEVSAGEIMLFGVRVKVDPMRKSVSMNDLSQYEQPHESSTADASAGYASADDAAHNQSPGNRERKRGIPWTEEEHKLFLVGLHRIGKGDWRGISRTFVKTRTPTQVASHAQKYFLRRSNLNRRRRRSSLFDITTDSVSTIRMEEEQVHQNKSSQPLLPTTQLQQSETSSMSGFSVPPLPMTVTPMLLPVQIENPMENMSLGLADQVNNASAELVRPVPVLPTPNSSTMKDLNLNKTLMVDSSLSPLSLKLSLSFDQNQSSRHSAFQAMPSFKKGDSIISVA